MVMQKARLVLLILLLSVPAIGFEAKDYVTYYGTSDGPVCIEWTASSGAIEYEVRAYHNEQKIYFWVGSISDTMITWQLPKSGHYTFMVRAGNNSGSSAWAESIDPTHAVVNGNPRAWWVYGHVAPPGPIVIE